MSRSLDAAERERGEERWQAACDHEVTGASSIPELDRIALATIEQWRFEVSSMPPDALVCDSREFQFRKD